MTRESTARKCKQSRVIGTLWVAHYICEVARKWCGEQPGLTVLRGLDFVPNDQLINGDNEIDDCAERRNNLIKTRDNPRYFKALSDAAWPKPDHNVQRSYNKKAPVITRQAIPRILTSLASTLLTADQAAAPDVADYRS
ncbi:hypothetical protein J6590_014041 [Homalodisca vitripennis]|nr:hypothetical protein J6590_014041 [Homalodisca vitripennis]